MSITLTSKLRKEYQDLFSTCTINSGKKSAVAVIRDKIVANRQRYEQVHQATNVPWFVVALIHSLEGSLSLKTHLYNGDPLTSDGKFAASAISKQCGTAAILKSLIAAGDVAPL